MPESLLISGFAFGLAGALHCAAMCGGIACGALLLLDAPTPKERYRQLAIMQAGRITTYATLGAVGGAIGAGLAARRGGISFEIMQWAAAVSLIWMGLVLAGAMPRLSFLDRGVSYLAQGFDTIAAPLRTRRTAGPYVLGVAWGLNACPMLYGAVFFSSLTGSALHGFLFMTGFGLGTLPAVFAAASGLTFLRTINAKWPVRFAAGMALALAGFATIYVPWPAIKGICLH
ncbi:sulfite exporter TauE/SafE family protein [Hyphomicrobium sp. 802]|uniref:sulfite exporter TauE/SafE family protein n=1 Tax=Hyphomicrobium sp. 802 TaxID=1112272 RepID=UPI00045E872B|nr:sulfite exporter TauE/SafE family protein [Hyphomicrobium sp. 802]